MAMLLLAMAISTVAYVFAGTCTRLGRSRVLTQGAFLAQAAMDAALLSDPFEPIGQSVPIGPPGGGFSFTLTSVPFTFNSAYFEVQVRVFHTSLPPNQPAVFLSSLRRSGGIVR